MEEKQAIQSTFDIHFDEEKGEWFITTGYCSIGGCPTYGIFKESKDAAYRKAAELELEGVKPTSNTACSSCVAELNQL